MTRAPASARGASAHRLAIEAARGRLSTVVDSVQEQPVLLTRRGRPVAAVITMEQYEVLRAAEGLADHWRARDGGRGPAVGQSVTGEGDTI